MEKRKCLVIILLIGVVFSCLLNKDSQNVQALQKGIASQVIRFHVLANSDSTEDQEIKLKVRDGVVAFVQQKLKKAESKEEAERIIRKNLSKIKREANKILEEEQYESRAVAKLTKEEFPVKVYGARTTRPTPGSGAVWPDRPDSAGTSPAKGRGRNRWDRSRARSQTPKSTRRADPARRRLRACP